MVGKKSLLLVFIVLALLFSGCAQQGAPTEKTPTAEKTAEAKKNVIVSNRSHRQGNRPRSSKCIRLLHMGSVE